MGERRAEAMGKKKGKKKKKGPDIEELSHRMEVQGDIDKMSFSGYKLMRLPEMVSDLLTLRECDLCNNRLRDFPEQVYDLENLEILDLSFNVISAIPPDVGRLSNVRVLRL